MKANFQKIYLCAILALLSPLHSVGQMNSNHNANQDVDFWDQVAYSAEQMEGRKLIDLKKFLTGMPQQPEAWLQYMLDNLNKGSADLETSTYQIGFLPSNSAQFEPTYEIRFTEKTAITEIKVHPELVKNPLYILDTLLMMEHLFKGGVTMTSSKLASYESVPQYFHTVHQKYYYDHSKKTTQYYHDHTWHTMTEALGLNVNAVDFDSDVMMLAELKSNALLGSVYAKKEIAKQQQAKVEAALDNYKSFILTKNLTEEAKKTALAEMASLHKIQIDLSNTSDEIAAQYFNERKARYHSQVQALDKAARERYRFERNLLANPDKKAEKEQLEKMSLKLNDLLMNNDRAGVANLLEAYLPFEVMEPIEKGIWNDWIDAIRDPKKEKSVVLYRGLDSENDKVQKSESSNGDKKIGLFSVLLTKNQGSFTRRLRSLTTMRYKIMGMPYLKNGASPIEVVPLMTRMLRTHSGNPVGSPVMSFSSDMRVAGIFASSGIVAVNIDKRRILPNFLGIPREFEILVPLVVFPDEVVAYAEGTKGQPLNEDRPKLNAFKSEVDRKIKEQQLSVLPEQDVNLLRTGYEVFRNSTSDGPGSLCRQIFK